MTGFKECVDYSKLKALASKKIREFKQKQKSDRKAKKVAALEIVRRFIPDAVKLHCNAEGAGLTEMGCMHYFYGPRTEIDSEFPTEFWIEINIMGPRDSNAFVRSLEIEYYGKQESDPGPTKVSFEMETEEVKVDWIDSDADGFPFEKDTLMKMIEELLLFYVPDSSYTRDRVYDAFEGEVASAIRKRE